MNLKKIVSGPLFWILLVVVGLIIVVPLLFSSSSESGQQVDTNVGMELIEEGQVTEARIDDGDSRVDLTLAEPYEADGQEVGESVNFHFSASRRQTVADAIGSADLEGYTDEPEQSNWLTSMLGFMIPFLLIAILFIWS